MRILLTIILTNILLAVFGQTDNRVTERIIYTVRLDDKSKKETSFYNHLDSTTKSNLINQICDLAYNKKLKLAHYWGDKVKALPDYYNIVGDHLLKHYYFRNDTIRYRYNSLPYEDRTSGDVKRDNYLYRYLINSLSFQEQWYFNKTKNIFTKKVDGVILFEDKYTHNIGMNCNYYVALNDTTPNEYNPKYLIAKNIIYDVPITKSDSEKCNETNWWYNYLEASKRERFLDLLTSKALYDTITPFQIYKPVYPYDSLMKRSPYVNAGLSKLYYGRSNWYSSDPLMFGMTDEKIQACCYELADWTTVRKIRFNEEWYFDAIKFRFEKKVLGIGIVVDTYNDKGEIIGEKCLVYYKLNN